MDTVVRPTLTLDWSKVEPLKLDPAQTIVTAEIAPALDGIAHLGQTQEIDLEKIPEGFRLQHQVSRAVRKRFESMRDCFCGTPEYLTVQLIGIVERFFASDRLEIPSLFHQDPLRKRILFALNLDLIVQHLLRFVGEQNAERLEPVFDEDSPTGTTAEMRTWYTSKPSRATTRSQISHAVADSTWESYTADALESKKHPQVLSYAKNDHLGFEILYLWKGSRRRFIPDYLVRFADGTTLVLEIKGEDSPRNQAKRAALNTWAKAINSKGGFGRWRWAVAFEPAEIHDILSRAG